jgi:hypothetical protein
MFNSATTGFSSALILDCRSRAENTRWPIRDWRRRRGKPNGGSATSSPLGPTEKHRRKANSHRHFDDKANAMAQPRSLPPFLLLGAGNNLQPLRLAQVAETGLRGPDLDGVIEQALRVLRNRSDLYPVVEAS